jgi:polar amino acid transport system permease protein
MSKRFSWLISYVLATFTFLFFIFLVIYVRDTPFNLVRLISIYGGLLAQGFSNTILISSITLIGSVLFGFLIYLISLSKFKYAVALVDVFTEIIYGTPLLVMMILMGFLIGPSFGYFNRPVLGITGLILYISPYMKNVFKSSFSSIPKDQYMVMDLYGLTNFQRYYYVITPQVIRILIPPLMNNFSLIIKGSASLSVLAYPELFQAINIISSESALSVEGYIAMWMLYLIITVPLSQITQWIEKKVRV